MLERIDRYELKERIGAGGQATVYLAEDTVLERQVAVKVMNQIVSEEEAFADRFMKEARLAASLTHRNIATVYDFKIEKDYACIIMEYLPNSVDKILQRKGPLSAPHASQITIHTSEALQHAHNNGVVHRDIKPHNILISPEGMAKVTDFGIARASDLISTTDTMGTPVYMSPEQCRRENVSDVRSDIYSLGISFYEMLSGHPPFQGSYQELTESHLNHTPPKFDSSLNIPTSLESIVMKCLAKDPVHRYQSAQELSTALRALFGGNTPQERPENLPSESYSVPSSEQPSNPTPVEVILKPSRWSRIVAAMSLTAAVIFLIINSEKIMNQFRDIDELVPVNSASIVEEPKQAITARLTSNMLSSDSMQPVIATPSQAPPINEEVEPESEVSINLEESDLRTIKSFELVKIDEMTYSVEFPWANNGGLSHFSKLSLFKTELGSSTSVTFEDISTEFLENLPNNLILRAVEFTLEYDLAENGNTFIEFDLDKEWLDSESIDLDRVLLLGNDGDKWIELETDYQGMSVGPSNQYYQRFESISEGSSIYLVSISN